MQDPVNSYLLHGTTASPGNRVGLIPSIGARSTRSHSFGPMPAQPLVDCIQMYIRTQQDAVLTTPYPDTPIGRPRNLTADKTRRRDVASSKFHVGAHAVAWPPLLSYAARIAVALPPS
ncbi:uncharacterized protein N7459_005659 [Penicillium hispanicum]|uniref:uncharacterized protein n=1 Tax=Penicillium hispanicum TaxID=1080232 RepID=UPI00254123FB|nr:uncharacterized protein N7459_005659 [Penicillium hispanicum]KAJ5579674.1 hypothetical protein N7459_005659 [Penicillium hispanicum]